MRRSELPRFLFLSACLVTLICRPAARAADTGTLRIEVADPNGVPVEGAKVVVTSPLLSSYRREAATDRKGRMTLLGLNPGEMVFHVEKEGYQAYESNFMAHAGEATVRKVTLQPPGSAAAAAEIRKEEDPAAVAFNEAVGLYRQDKVAEALGKVDEALRSKEGFPPALALKGIILADQGRCVEAIPLLKQACQVESPAPSALAALIGCLDKEGMREESVSWRQRQAQVGRSKTDLYNEAVQKINAGDDAAAAPLLERAIQQDAGFAQAQYQYGLILFRRGDIAGAVSRLETYLKLAPEGEFAADARELLKALNP